MIPAEIISNQRAFEVLQHALGMLATPAGAEIKQHRTLGYKVGRAVHPHVSLLGLAPPRRQERDRRLIGMHHGVAQDEILECIGQRRQARAADSNPLRHA